MKREELLAIWLGMACPSYRDYGDRWKPTIEIPVAMRTRVESGEFGSIATAAARE